MSMYESCCNGDKNAVYEFITVPKNFINNK